MVTSQGNTYIIIYDKAGFPCTNAENGWQHTCHYKVWTADSQSCTYDPLHTKMQATDNLHDAIEYRFADSYYGATYNPDTKGVPIASNCKSYIAGSKTLVPVNYEPRQSQQIADYAACGIAFAATVCLFIGVRRLLSMLHSAVLARKG